jgi:hypothetical protein
MDREVRAGLEIIDTIPTDSLANTVRMMMD